MASATLLAVSSLRSLTHHSCACGGKGFRDCFSNSVATASDDCDLVVHGEVFLVIHNFVNL
jgi:hypothetical protein